MGTRLTSSAELAASHRQTNHCEVHQPFAELQERGQRTDRADGAARRRHAGEEFAGVGRAGVVVEKRVEPCQSQHDAHRVEQHEDPADRRLRQQRHVDDERGRHAEVDGVGERIDLGAHPGLGVECAGDAAVDPVQYGGGTDERQRNVRPVVQGELDRRQACADGQHRGGAGQDAHCPGAVAAATGLGHGNSASGVSPPMARWPSSTSTFAPAGK